MYNVQSWKDIYIIKFAKVISLSISLKLWQIMISYCSFIITSRQQCHCNFISCGQEISLRISFYPGSNIISACHHDIIYNIITSGQEYYIFIGISYIINPLMWLCNTPDDLKMPFACSGTHSLIILWPQIESYLKIAWPPPAGKQMPNSTNLSIKTS